MEANEARSFGVDFQTRALGDAGDGERQNITTIDVKGLVGMSGFDQSTTNRQDRRGRPDRDAARGADVRADQSGAASLILPIR